MRIIRGTYKGKRIHPPKGFSARPTTDFAKENLFNILEHTYDISTLTVLDLFAGTGSISFEFASRGALQIDLVEMRAVHFRFIKDTLEKLGITQVKPFKYDAIKYIRKCTRRYDIIFADPPYTFRSLSTIPDLVFAGEILKPGGMFILEHGKDHNFTSDPHFSEMRTYGSVHFSFFRLNP